MAIREILEVPDPRLKTISKPVETFDDGLKALVSDMFETMYAAHGIGLAAIQVGEPLPIMVSNILERHPNPSGSTATRCDCSFRRGSMSRRRRAPISPALPSSRAPC